MAERRSRSGHVFHAPPYSEEELDDLYSRLYDVREIVVVHGHSSLKPSSGSPDYKRRSAPISLL